MHIKLTSRVVFEAKSSKDVHIALATTTNSTDLYEIVIGAGSNTFSTIRRCKLCADLVYRGTAFYLNSDEYRRFWITFGKNGSITVGKDDESSPFLEWTDPDPLEINYLGYSTGWKSKGDFRFCNFGENYILYSINPNLCLFWRCSDYMLIQKHVDKKVCHMQRKRRNLLAKLTKNEKIYSGTYH